MYSVVIEEVGLGRVTVSGGGFRSRNLSIDPATHARLPQTIDTSAPLIWDRMRNVQHYYKKNPFYTVIEGGKTVAKIDPIVHKLPLDQATVKAAVQSAKMRSFNPSSLATKASVGVKMGGGLVHKEKKKIYNAKIMLTYVEDSIIIIHVMIIIA